jgi:hypothetical protein
MLRIRSHGLIKTSWAAGLVGSRGLASVLPAYASIVGGDLNSILGVSSEAYEKSRFVVVGPVERIDARKRILVVLGQTYAIDKSTQFVSSSGQVGIGSYVAMAGSAEVAGAVTAARVQLLASAYVDGSSLTYVRGTVRTLDQSLGRLSVGKLQIDYTVSLGNVDTAVPTVGETAEFSGIRPSQNGVMLAYSTKIPASKSIIGGDLQGKSIIGGDAQSIIGGDLQGKSIIGGDAQSIIGGDLQGKSIIGGDLQGKSIIGGDLQGKSIIGGDLQGKSIIGGDLQGKSIIGGDAQSIIGGDLQGKSIIGGDLHDKSIIGGDAQSIIGGDLQGKSIIGGDTQSIIGGDLQGKSIIGGDAR